MNIWYLNMHRCTFVSSKAFANEGATPVIELTPLTEAAAEMRNELEFACKYFRSAWTAQSDCMHEPEYQMWQSFEQLLLRIQSAEAERAKGGV